MVHLKPEYADPHARYVNGVKYKIVKVKRHRINPAKIARAMTLWQVIVESLMERYPWAIIENVFDWFVYKIQAWSSPKFAVPLTSTGKTIHVPSKVSKQPEWVVLSTKKAQR